MTTQPSTFSFQGKCYLATRDANGNAGSMIYVQNAPSLTLAVATTTKDHQESTSGQRVTDDRLITAKSVSATLTLDQWSPANLALGLYGTSTAVAAGTATAEALPDDLAANDYVKLANPNVSDVVITDATGTPKTLVAGTDYVVTSAAGGILQILSIDSYTQPFKAAYSYAGSTDVSIFSTTPPERWLVFDGVNTVNNKPVLVDLYRVRFDPLKQLALINDDYGNMELDGSCMWDATKPVDSVLGNFGRIRSA